MPRYGVSVPGNPGDPPHPVTGKSVIKVANWILKGVQKAHHGRPELLPHFSAWQHFTGPVAVPQYVEDAGDRRFGDFDFNLRPVLWDVDDFVRLAMSEIEGRDGAVVAECQGNPHFTLVATDGIASPAPWILALEYVFRIVWVLPRDDGSELEPGTIIADTNAWEVAKRTNREIAFYDVKPNRDGRLSWNSMQRVHQRAAEHQAHPERFDAGRTGVRSSQSAMYEGGAMSKGWQGQRAQAKHVGEANRQLVKASPATPHFRWNGGVLGPPPPPRPSRAPPPPAAADASSSSSSGDLPPTAAASALADEVARALADDVARADNLEAAQLQSALALVDSWIAEDAQIAAADAEAPAVAKKAPPPLPPVAKAQGPSADSVLAAIPEGAPVNPVSAGVPKATQNWRDVGGDNRDLRQARRNAGRTPVEDPAVDAEEEALEARRRNQWPDGMPYQGPLVNTHQSWWAAGWTGWGTQ